MLKTYETKMTLIEDELTEVFSRLIKASNIALAGAKDKDISRFKEAKESFTTITADCEDIDSNVITALALFSPEAKDLRKLVSYLKITSGLNKTAVNIKAYIKSIIKNFEEYESYFTKTTYIESLIKSSITALECTMKIIHEDDKDTLEDLFKQINVEVDKTDTVYDLVEKELHSVDKMTVKLLTKNSAILKTFRKLDKTTNRIMDIASALLHAKIV